MTAAPGRRVKIGDLRLDDSDRRALTDVIDSGRLSEGPAVRDFERAWATAVGTRYCVATSSGFGALVVGLSALRHHRQYNHARKVITTPLSYIATASAIAAAGFEPVFVDVDPETFVITPEAVGAMLGAEEAQGTYAAVLPVHLMGYPVDMAEMARVAGRTGVAVIEDAAQAHGTTLRDGGQAGSRSLFSAFSFYIAHNIQAGEMGAVNTSDIEMARLVRQLKAQGRTCDCLVCTRDDGRCPRRDDFSDPRFTHEFVGWNFKAVELHAALGRNQIARLPEIVARRGENVRRLNSILARHEEHFQLPTASPNVSHLAYPLVIREPGRIRRQALLRALESAGVGARPLFGCIPTQQPAFRWLAERYRGKLPNAERLGANGFYVGCHQYLTNEDLEYIGAAFDEIVPRLLGGTHEWTASDDRAL